MYNSVGVPFSKSRSSGSAAEFWIHVEQVKAESETPTLGEVAELVNSLLGVDPCDKYVDVITTPFNEEEDYSDIPDDIFKDAAIAQRKASKVQEKAAFFLSKVQEYAKFDMCSIDSSTGDYETQLKVGRSHQTEEYSLLILDGRVTKTVEIREIFSKDYEIEKGYSIDLPFPIINDVNNSFSFENVVYGPFGPETSPDVTITGRTLSWEGPVTGTLSVSYKTVYDLVDIIVYGSDESELRDAEALCSYKGMIDATDIEPPEQDPTSTETDKAKYCDAINRIEFTVGPNTDVVTCYEVVTYEYRCKCAPDTVAYSVEKKEIVTCPDDIRCGLGLMSDTRKVGDHYECSSYMGSRTVVADYVSCPDSLYNNQMGSYAPNPERSRVSYPEYYEKICCVPPEGDLPLCVSLYEKNRGKQLDKDVLAELQRRYGDRLRLLPVSPKDGDCGYTKTDVAVKPLACCEFVEPLEIDSDKSATVLSDSSSGIVFLTAASARLTTVEVHGDGFYAKSDGRSKTAAYEGGSGFLVFTKEACGKCQVVISDGCSTVTHTVTSTNGKWSDMIGDPYIGHEVAPVAPFGAYTIIYNYGGRVQITGGNHAYRQYEMLGNTAGCGATACISHCYSYCGEPEMCEWEGKYIGTYSADPCYTMESVFDRPYWYSSPPDCPPGTTKNCACTCISGHAYKEWIC